VKRGEGGRHLLIENWEARQLGQRVVRKEGSAILLDDEETSRLKLAPYKKEGEKKRSRCLYSGRRSKKAGKPQGGRSFARRRGDYAE